MFYHRQTNTYINEGTAFKIGEQQYPADWLNLASPEDKAQHGLEEVLTVGEQNLSDEFYSSIEYVDGKAVWQNVRKSDEQIAQLNRSKLIEAINRLEAEITPRRVREALIGNTGWLVQQDARIDELRTQLQGG